MFVADVRPRSDYPAFRIRRFGLGTRSVTSVPGTTGGYFTSMKPIVVVVLAFIVGVRSAGCSRTPQMSAPG